MRHVDLYAKFASCAEDQYFTEKMSFKRVEDFVNCINQLHCRIKIRFAELKVMTGTCHLSLLHEILIHLMELDQALSNEDHHKNQENCTRCHKCSKCQKKDKKKHKNKKGWKNCKLGCCSFKKKKYNPHWHVNNKSHCVCRICADSRLRFSDTSTCDITCIQVAFHNNAGIENLEEASEFHDILSHFNSEDILHLRFLGIGGHVPLFPCQYERHKSILKSPLKQNSFLFLQISKDCCLPNKPLCVSFSFLFIFPNSLSTLNKSCYLGTKYISKVEDTSNKSNPLPDSLAYSLRNEEISAFVKKFFKRHRQIESESVKVNETKSEIFGVKKNKKDENYKSFYERVRENIYELFSSVEIRYDEIVAYPATQQPVLEPILNKFSIPESAPSKHDTMAVEFLRLCTMHDYPNTNGPSLLRLAQAGFFYEGNGNELVCFSCDFRKGSWNFNDSPREIHLRMSPNCKFLSQGGDGNVPVPREESTQDLVPLQSTPQVGVVEPDGPRAAYNGSTSNNTAHLASANYSNGQDQSDMTRRTMVVKHPEYASRPARLASYANFPRHMKQHPADMTDAGFYYAGFGDCCRCFHCGIGLRNWDPEDNPWIEHARWSMECPYILKIKGQAFIDLVQEAARAAEMAQDDEDSEAEGASTGNESDSGNKEKSGASNSSASGGPAANEIENNVAKTSEATMSKGTSDDSGFGSGSAPVAQPIKAPLRTAAAQSLIHDEKIKPKYVTAAIEDLVKAEGWGAFSKENIRKYLKIHEENRKSATSASNADPSTLKQENKELKDLTICKICLDEKVSIVFLPCGHLVSCPQCAPALTKCPICRKNIKGTVRTNLVEKTTAK